MKSLFSIIFLLAIHLGGFAQVADTVNIEEENGYPELPQADTLKIEAGKPYAFLIDIPEYLVQTAGDDLENEGKELKNNFKDENLEVILIKKHSFVKLESGQGLDMTDFNKPFLATAYWSGNVNEEVELFSGITNTTEFIAEKMGLQKESSYNINARLSNEEVRKLTSQNNITENSKITLNKLLHTYQTPFLAENGDFLFVQDVPKIKNITIHFVENGKDKPYKNYEFNTLGNITSETEYNSEGKQTGRQTFVYENNMLTRIVKKEKTATVNFDDDKMIISENIGGANETTVVWVENNRLLTKRYILMTDSGYADKNMIMEEKLTDNCITDYLNGKIVNKACSSPYGAFPYFHVETYYQSAAAGQGNEYIQVTKYKVEKKSATVFEKYYSEAQNETEKDAYKLFATIYLNENSLISKIISTEKTVKIEYAYYP